MFRYVFIAALATLLSACRLELVAPSGGAIVSESGSFSCAAGESCVVEVDDLFFDENFTGQPTDGNMFTGWARRNRGFCGGSVDDCALSTAGFADDEDLQALLASDETFYLEALFEREPGPLFLVRYCEVLLASLGSEGITASVYGSQGLNDCPQEDWAQLDAAQIAEDNGAAQAILNGPRFWVLDLITRPAEDFPDVDGTVFFGDIEMRLFASVSLPADAASGSGPYQGATVARDTVWHYSAGRRIYELVDPQGVRYVMQSFSRIVDSDQTLADLASLGQRLDLPAGWSFDTRLLEEDLKLPSTDGFAVVITDDLANTYQRVE